MTSARRKGEGVECEHVLGQQPLQLYTYLWSKAGADGRHSCKQTFSFVLTDTVVFKRQKPVKWFFTSKQERGKILCKSKRFLSTSHVLQEFLVPQWAPNTLPKLNKDKQVLATYAYMDQSPLSGEMYMIIEHLDRAALEHLLENRDKPLFCVLQRFIPTQSGYNHVIRSVYTAGGCTLQKCISPYFLSDTKATMVQRTATFEANDPLLRHCTVTDKEVQRNIGKVNGEISAHLEAIVGKKTVRFVNYFKIGADHRVYLLWSSMLSFDASTKGTARNCTLALKNRAVSASVASITTGDKETPNQSLIGCAAQLKICPSCNQTFPRNQVEYVVTHMSVIRQFERESNQTTESVPTLFRAIRSSVQAERLKQLKQSATYLYQTVQLCISCARYINVGPKSCTPPSQESKTHTNHIQEMVKEDGKLKVNPNVLKASKYVEQAKEEEAREAKATGIVAYTRAISASSTRMSSFLTKSSYHGSNRHQQHLRQALIPSELSPREHFAQFTKASCPVIPRVLSATIYAPRKPGQPRSCTPTSAPSRMSRRLSLLRKSSKELPGDDSDGR